MYVFTGLWSFFSLSRHKCQYNKETPLLLHNSRNYPDFMLFVSKANWMEESFADVEVSPFNWWENAGKGKRRAHPQEGFKKQQGWTVWRKSVLVPAPPTISKEKGIVLALLSARRSSKFWKRKLHQICAHLSKQWESAQGIVYNYCKLLTLFSSQKYPIAPQPRRQ